MWFSSDGSQFWAWIPPKGFCTCWQWQQSFTRIETGDVSLLYNVQLRRRSALSIGGWYRRSGVRTGLHVGRRYRGLGYWSVGSKWGSTQGACTEQWVQTGRLYRRVGSKRAPHRAPTLRSRDQMRLHTGHLYWGVGSIRGSIRGSGIKEWRPKRVHKVGST